MFKVIWSQLTRLIYSRQAASAMGTKPVQQPADLVAEIEKNMSVTYSIRESLQGALHDFVRSSGFENVHLEEMIRELVGMLASYREEGLPLFPEVFLFSSTNGLTALAPSSTQITLGKARLEADSSADILKGCAPLAASGWAIFVVKEENGVRYGLFRASRHALAMGAEESMLGLGRDEPVIIIRNRGHLTVELRSATGDRFNAVLTTSSAKTSSLEKHVEIFVTAATEALMDGEDFRPYLRRLLTDTLQRCHGTLLGVVEDQQTEIDPTFRDGTWPSPRIALAELRAAAAKTATADSLADLTAAEVLVQGMINSDGIVLFGSDGSVLAFRVFLKPNDEEATKLPESGGGRRRTYELMKLRLGAAFKAVFFRSQDGQTACERAKDG